MKFLPFCPQQLAVAVLILHVTSTLALDLLNSTWYKIENSFDDAKSWFETQVALEAAKGLSGIHGVLAQVPIGYSEVPPISSSLKTSMVQSKITVGLYDPSGNYTQPEAFDFAENRYNGWADGWFGVALDSFDAIIELDIDLSASASTGDLTLSLLKKSASWNGVAVEVEFQLYLTADAAASMSFTTGLNLTLANPSAIMMPALNNSIIIDLKGSKNIGFSSDDFILTPIFNATMPQLDFSASLSLRTVFSVNVEDIDVGALYLDLPAFDLGVTTLQNKMSNCKTPPAGTPPDQIYAELIHLSASLDAKLSYELLDDEFSGEIESWAMFDLLDECYAFFPGSGYIGRVPASSKDPILTAAAVTTCTTDGRTTIRTALKALSPGDKAAIAIGTLLGASLVAALAWYGGRASQRHSIKKHGIDGARGSPRPWVRNLFDLGRRHGSPVFLFTSKTPVRQTENESGSFLPNSDAELPTQQGRRNWLKRKPVPSAATIETGITPSAEMSLNDDYDTPRAGLSETGNMRDNTES